MERINLEGNYSVEIGSKTYEAVLPGTLDTNCIGELETVAKKWHPDALIDESDTFKSNGKILTRLTRKHTYEGCAIFTKIMYINLKDNSRYFINVERSRDLALKINDENISHFEEGSIATPHIFEITDFIKNGENKIQFACDNSYPNWTHDPIFFSSAATDETQTNWNGLIGKLELIIEKTNFISNIRLYPNLHNVDIEIDVDCKAPLETTINVECDAFKTITKDVSLKLGKNTVVINSILFSDNIKYWDIEEGNLYDVKVFAKELEQKNVSFGIRKFAGKAGRFVLNDRCIFIRSEANTALFPETGHWPMDVNSWKQIIQTYRNYGVNYLRFHSHCPPEAAFIAADEMGMMMQPELAHWNPKTAFEDDKDYNYYKSELTCILNTYCNHPSFVALTFGNELASGAKGYKRMQALVKYAKKLDKTRLYATGSNNFYGWYGPDLVSDFYTGTNFYNDDLRATFAGMGGYLNRDYPNTKHNYNISMNHLREEYAKPVMEFEVGQYEILPDFDEIDDYKGVTIPNNIIHVKEKAIEEGMIDNWKKYVEATGELSLLCYREEVEACLRTKEMSGISLLGLQDFLGQGTALVGMLNAHLQPKPYSFADPARFKAFFTDVLPLVTMEKYTYFEQENIKLSISLANYGKKDIFSKTLLELIDKDENLVTKYEYNAQNYPYGQLSNVCKLVFVLPSVKQSAKYTLKVTIGQAINTYPIWIYKNEYVKNEDILVTTSLKLAIENLNKGKSVLLAPVSNEKHFPNSIKAQFSTDFWSVGTFPSQSGFMGCVVDNTHPAFSKFPTENHSNWQWWKLSSYRAMVLPKGFKSIVTGADSYAKMRNLSLLFEVKVGKGKLLVSSMNLIKDKRLPEVNAMLASLCNYMLSPDFNPKQTMTTKQLKEIIAK